MARTLYEQLKCAERELALRKNTYPQWVTLGKLGAEQARYQIECMESIVATLDKLLHLEQASEELKKCAPTSTFAPVSEDSASDLKQQDSRQ